MFQTKRLPKMQKSTWTRSFAWPTAGSKPGRRQRCDTGRIDRAVQTDKAFESDAHLKNWLIRVTVNRCKMLFRSPWRRHEDIDDYAETLSFEQPRDGELFKAVMALDKKYRVPLLLFYYEGYSTAEIASMLSLAEKTVSTRLFRARAKLRTILEEE